jgi:hypothetical protein
MRCTPAAFLALALLAGCASGPGDDDSPKGTGFVRGQLGGQTVDIPRRIYLNQAPDAPYTVLVLSRLGRDLPILPRDNVFVGFPGRRPGSFRIGDNAGGPARSDSDVQVQVWYGGWKWYGVDGQLDVTHLRWKGEDVRELRGCYRGRFWSSAEEQVVPGELTFAYTQ